MLQLDSSRLLIADSKPLHFKQEPMFVLLHLHFFLFDLGYLFFVALAFGPWFASLGCCALVNTDLERRLKLLGK